MVASDIYLFLGEDTISKDRKIGLLKKAALKDGGQEFNFDIFYAKELSLARLKEALGRLPCGVSKRIVVIKNIEQFAPAQKDYLISFLETPPEQIILILESPHDNKDVFIAKILPWTKVYRFKSARPLNAFDLARAISQGRVNAALNILSRIISEEKEATKILGAIFWQWRRDKNQLPLRRQQRELKLFLDADIAIKSGRLKPPMALELLTIKLCQKVS
ncbi:MAG: hypothetical protein V1674_02250 [Candidatus Omnitrophota bacterium]